MNGSQSFCTKFEEKNGANEGSKKYGIVKYGTKGWVEGGKEYKLKLRVRVIKGNNKFDW